MLKLVYNPETGKLEEHWTDEDGGGGGGTDEDSSEGLSSDLQIGPVGFTPMTPDEQAASDSAYFGNMSDDEYQQWLNDEGTGGAGGSQVFGDGTGNGSNGVMNAVNNLFGSKGSNGQSSGGGMNLLSALGGFFKGKSDAQMSEKEIALRKYLGELADRRDRDIATQATASKESGLSPFRQQMDQAGAVSSLDMLERSAFSPVSMSVPAGMERYVPKSTGGTTYSKSPEAIDAYAKLKANVLGGNTAPTMTQPGNYGKTAAMNLLPMLTAAGQPAPITQGAGTPITPPADQSSGLPPGAESASGSAWLLGTEPPGRPPAGILPLDPGVHPQDVGGMLPSYADILDDDTGTPKKRRSRADLQF